MNELTILVIEDDKTIQNFLKISLQTKGYKYILADNGLSGISYFYADNPDLILLDLWDFCKKRKISDRRC